MPKASRVSRDEEIRVVRALRTYTTETELYVGAAGREHHMYRTDLAALAVVMDRTDQGERVTPGVLSETLNLSPSATSAVLDRLEQAGHVRRGPHPADRRSVVVDVTDHARAVGGSMFGRLGAHIGRVMSDYTDDQLTVIAEFLERACDATRRATQDTETERLGRSSTDPNR